MKDPATPTSHNAHGYTVIRLYGYMAICIRLYVRAERKRKKIKYSNQIVKYILFDVSVYEILHERATYKHTKLGPSIDVIFHI